MEVFPERDGNAYPVAPVCHATVEMSEWRSSLKGMETDGSKLWNFSVFVSVRMEVFPERDGNFLLGLVGMDAT